MPRTETIACGIRGPMPPDGTFCISSRRVWRPGSYDSQATARRAQKLTDGSFSDCKLPRTNGLVAPAAPLRQRI